MRTDRDLSYGVLPEQVLDAYLPEQESYDTLLWFHGGGIEAGDKANIPFVGDLVAAGVGVYSANYRMYPQARYPEFIQDAALAVKWVLDRIPGRLYISGSSAGAYLTMMLCMEPAYLRNVGVDPSRIAGYISDSAQMTVHFNVLRERGQDSRLERIDEAAPIYYLSASIPLPRLLLICYEDDIPCRPEQTKLFYRSALRLRPEADIELVVLPGGHCAGGTFRDDDGQYPYVKCALQFMVR